MIYPKISSGGYKKAMKLMLQGKFVWKNISENKLYSALELKIDDPK